MSEHQAAEALEAALKFEVQKLRQVAAGEIDPIDESRVVLAGQIDHKPGRPPDSGHPSGPVVPTRLAEQELKRLNVQREQRNQALIRDIEQLVATAQRADYTYRQEFEGYSASGHRLKPVEFDLPPKDTGPIPDPVGSESATTEHPATGLRVVGNDPR